MTQNKMDRVNDGKWWRMVHPDCTTARFIVTHAPRLVKDRTVDNVEMRLEVWGKRDRVPLTCSLRDMREQWHELEEEGFVYNGD